MSNITLKTNQKLTPIKILPVVIFNKIDSFDIVDFFIKKFTKHGLVIVLSRDLGGNVSNDDYSGMISNFSKFISACERSILKSNNNNVVQLKNVSFLSLIQTFNSIIEKYDYIYNRTIKTNNPNYPSANTYTHACFCHSSSSKTTLESLLATCSASYYNEERKILFKTKTNKEIAPNEFVVYRTGYYFLNNEMLLSNKQEEFNQLI